MFKILCCCVTLAARALREAWRLLLQNPGLTLEKGLPPAAKKAVDAATKQMYKHRKKMERQAGRLQKAQ
jgi:hypothetical protein